VLVAPARVPNAVRVRIGKKYAYYPIGMFKALKNGEAVVTEHKHFKQASLEASGTDVVVLGYAPT
jgi:hypothetical protein